MQWSCIAYCCSAGREIESPIGRKFLRRAGARADIGPVAPEGFEGCAGAVAPGSGEGLAVVR